MTADNGISIDYMENISCKLVSLHHCFFQGSLFINRYLDEQSLDHSMSRQILVGTLAAITGWVVDKLDGDVDAPQNNASLTDIMQSGVPTRVLTVLSGLK